MKMCNSNRMVSIHSALELPVFPCLDKGAKNQALYSPFSLCLEVPALDSTAQIVSPVTHNGCPNPHSHPAFIIPHHSRKGIIFKL